MNLHTIQTYKNVDELRKIQAEVEVYPFEFQKTKLLLEATPNACIDITSLLYNLDSQKCNVQSAYNNFAAITEDTIIIACETIATKGIELLPFLFDTIQPYFHTKDHQEDHLDKVWRVERKTLYTYKGRENLERILDYSEKNNVPILTFSQAIDNDKDVIHTFSRFDMISIIDLTSVALSINGSKNLIYLVEQLFSSFPQVSIIAENSATDILMEYFPLYLDNVEPINALLPSLETGPDETKNETIRKITDLQPPELESFFSFFSHNLIGHDKFKDSVKQSISDFLILNKIGKQKILSIFLFGESGIGKTEVARLFAEGLNTNKAYYTKISFQNYSRQDALNSLIGSPSGYFGCENGELSTKLLKSKIGIILCDEFEKAAYPVLVFFLELLEEGKFTDSLSREYDLDGYVIVFTSNILSEDEFNQKIPAELRTRFDLICEFSRPSKDNIKEYIELLMEKIKSENKEFYEKLDESDISSLIHYDYYSIGSLREIKKKFYSLFVRLSSQNK